MNLISKAGVFKGLRYLKVNMSSVKDCGCARPVTTAVNPPEPSNNAIAPKKTIFSENAPKPVGPYSQAVAYDKTLYVSGCLGLNKDTMKLVDGGVVAEARQALISLGHILEAGGSNYASVLKTTVFLEDINDFAAVNEVYKQFFTGECPGRSCFQVGKLPLGAKVEIEAIAGIA